MPSPQRTEVVLIDLGRIPNEVVGHEQANRRPCLVIQTLDYSQLAVVVPITTQIPPSYISSIVKLMQGTGGLPADSHALCHQIRTVSYKRILKSYGSVPTRDFNKVLTVLADFLDIQ